MLGRCTNMDQNEAPIVDALAAIERHPIIGFGAPGHHQGSAMPSGMARLVGKRAFAADVLTPKGLDDRTESLHAVQRAHEIAAEAWGADLCRFATAGSTQSLHTLISAVVRPGETILIAANAHKAEFSAVLMAGLVPVVVPVAIDEGWDIEHGVEPDTLAGLLDAHPAAKAVVVVSPSYFGVTGDIAALSTVCHARGVPLIVDAAWGAAFAFSARLPADPLALGADAMACSLHKTMCALAQGSVMLARGGLIDLQRLALAYELFQTTSPSVPILASLDATRRDHALHGERLWGEVLDLARTARRDLAKIPGVRVFARSDLAPPGAYDLDETKLLLDITALGTTGYAIDDWLVENWKVSVGLSDARHLLVTVALGTTVRDVRALVAGLKALSELLSTDPKALPAAPSAIPGVATLQFELAMPSHDALFAAVEELPIGEAEGRIAAEFIAPAPPAIPRLVPGQRISRAHVAFLLAQRAAGAFFLDPTDPSERMIRVVR